ncbi:MAG: flagellar assembly peptidoglycan hydrolase FlgJ [Burkholderiaceae bacterium]|nr:flagellar assembly peptidoglycan hydrolase FlgJ [Rhodoferax sp.]MCB2029336.1 flagellar assembly peptidoglycan hydrolase FlgJ [Rhodoferax sp.]MCP5263160.1 flagellar assembly peptidoglycan hydrolase FlgJ [Rhodoferax sp.]
MSTGSFSSNLNALAADSRSLDALKLKAGQNSASAIKDAARQFESLFMRELIKSMREATMKSGLLDSPGGDLSADMLDQQMSVQMSGLQGGLSDMIARQLAQRISGESVPVPSTAPVLAPIESTGARRPSDSQSEFVQRHAQAAARVEQSSGIPAAFMLGQAGHETGWGRSEIRMADGSPSHNLFGIKATGGWSGKVAEITTTEYVNGVAQKVVAKFRAYDSYEDSLRDYARLITESPRYAQVSQQTDSVQAWTTGLQRAGYATDPDYASKLSRAINTTLQLQRART